MSSRGLGFVFDEVEVEGWQAVGGAIPDDTLQALILLDNGDSTLMLLSYELTLEQLADFTGAVHNVGDEEWIRAGGVIQ